MNKSHQRAAYKHKASSSTAKKPLSAAGAKKKLLSRTRSRPRTAPRRALHTKSKPLFKAQLPAPPQLSPIKKSFTTIKRFQEPSVALAPTPNTRNQQQFQPKSKLPSVIFNNAIKKPVVSVQTLPYSSLVKQQMKFPGSGVLADEEPLTELFPKSPKLAQQPLPLAQTVAGISLPTINFLPKHNVVMESPVMTQQRSFSSRWWPTNWRTGPPLASETSTYQASYTVDETGNGSYKIVEGYGNNKTPMRYEMTQGSINPDGSFGPKSTVTLSHDPFAEPESSTNRPRIASWGGSSSLGDQAAKALAEGEKNVATAGAGAGATGHGHPTVAAFTQTRTPRSDSSFPNHHFDIVTEAESFIKESRKMSAAQPRDAEVNHSRHWRETWE